MGNQILQGSTHIQSPELYPIFLAWAIIKAVVSKPPCTEFYFNSSDLTKLLKLVQRFHKIY